MITPKDIFEKSDKQFFKTVTAVFNNDEVFPLLIPANKSLAGTGYSDLKSALVPLYQQSKAVKGKGYSVDWRDKTIDGTKQKIPAKIYFENLEDFLYSTKRNADYVKIQNAFQELTASFQELTAWAKQNPSFLLDHLEVLADLIRVCKYFQNNQPPHHLYLRELPVEVHSKFIEDNSKALRKLLDLLLPADWVKANENDFSVRYGIKKSNVYTQIRILDEILRPSVGFDELALTLDDSALLNWLPDKVFIIENKACFLSFPKVKNAVAIFGEGFKSRLSRHIPWLEKAQLYCWFDMDPAGFEMLNTIRQYYPKTKSFLMDEKTFKTFERFSVIDAYRKIRLSHLNDEEAGMYSLLQASSRRLEQERITNQYITHSLNKL